MRYTRVASGVISVYNSSLVIIVVRQRGMQSSTEGAFTVCCIVVESRLCTIDLQRGHINPSQSSSPFNVHVGSTGLACSTPSERPSSKHHIVTNPWMLNSRVSGGWSTSTRLEEPAALWVLSAGRTDCTESSLSTHTRSLLARAWPCLAWLPVVSPTLVPCSVNSSLRWKRFIVDIASLWSLIVLPSSLTGACLTRFGSLLSIVNILFH